MHTILRLLQSRHIETAAPSETALEGARRMTRANIGAIAVVDGGRLVGMFSERDLMTRVIVAGRDPAQTPIGEVMTRKLVTANVNDTRGSILAKMEGAGCRHLPVVEEGCLAAMLSMRDLLHDEIEEQHEEIQSLRAYLHQTSVA